MAIKKDILDTHWQALLETEFDQAYMHDLFSFLDAEAAAGHTIYPAQDDIFAALNATPVDKIKVVILGQDPYHGANQAHGLSFSVPHGIAIPPSLRNIIKELQSDLGVPPTNHGNLLNWAQQGVLLLNSVLTVRANSPGSHQGKGWERFTDAIIQAVNQHTSACVFMLWGAYAHKKGAHIDQSKHLVLRSTHPSPLSAYRGFLGCRHFSQANDWLTQQGREAINWQI